MEKLSEDLSQLVYSHISIGQQLLTNWLYLEQLDFLSFWVDPEKMKNNPPFTLNENGFIIRDNPNRETTIYDNIYKLQEEDKIVLQYVVDGRSPVAILQRYKMNLKGQEKRKMSIYWKGLRLYYCGYLDWLPDYIDMYCGEVIRADLCWDNKDRVPAWVIDLPNTVTYWEGEDWTYKGFWNKRSPFFIRIYDKTLDLKKDHNSMAWLYPDWYTSSCWRLECKFTWRYAQSLTALQWLGVCERDWKIQKLKSQKRDYLKSAFFNLIMYIDFIPDKKKQFDLLQSISVLVWKKLKKLKYFISCDSEDD